MERAQFRTESKQTYYEGLNSAELYFWFQVPLEGIGEQYVLRPSNIMEIYPAMTEFIEMGGIIADEDFDRFLAIAGLYWGLMLDSTSYDTSYVQRQIAVLSTIRQGLPFAVGQFCQLQIDLHEEAVAQAVRVREQEIIDAAWERAEGWRNQMMEVGFIPTSRFERKPRFIPIRR